MSRIHRDAYAQVATDAQVTANGATTLTVPAGATGIKMSNVLAYATSFATNGATYSLYEALAGLDEGMPIAQPNAGGDLETVVWFGAGQKYVYLFLSNPATVNYCFIRPIRTH